MMWRCEITEEKYVYIILLLLFGPIRSQKSEYRIVVSTARCGRANAGSIPAIRSTGVWTLNSSGRSMYAHNFVFFPLLLLSLTYSFASLPHFSF